MNKIAGKPFPIWTLVVGLAFPLVGWMGLMLAENASRPRSKPQETRLTADNFLRVQRGMLMSDVLVILGEPTDRDHVAGSRRETLRWEDGGRTIWVIFESARSTAPPLVVDKHEMGL